MRPRVFVLENCLDQATQDSIDRGEAPLADRFLLHNEINFRWLAVSDLVAVYIDAGITVEMRELLTEAVRIRTPIELRRLDGKPVPGFIWMHRNDVPHAPCPICVGPRIVARKIPKP